MRISDWSSDVCSNDRSARDRHDEQCVRGASCARANGTAIRRSSHSSQEIYRWLDDAPSNPGIQHLGRAGRLVAAWRQRSDEHTSELQSLLRISYAVFCLNSNI